MKKIVTNSYMRLCKDAKNGTEQLNDAGNGSKEDIIACFKSW